MNSNHFFRGPAQPILVSWIFYLSIVGQSLQHGSSRLKELKHILNLVHDIPVVHCANVLYSTYHSKLSSLFQRGHLLLHGAGTEVPKLFKITRDTITFSRARTGGPDAWNATYTSAFVPKPVVPTLRMESGVVIAETLEVKLGLLLETSEKLSKHLPSRRQDVAGETDRETDWVSVAVFLSNSVIDALVFRFLTVRFPDLVEAYDAHARKQELRWGVLVDLVFGVGQSVEAAAATVDDMFECPKMNDAAADWFPGFLGRHRRASEALDEVVSILRRQEEMRLRL